MNRIFSYKLFFLLVFLYIQSINLKVLPKESKVFPDQKGDYQICPNGNTLSNWKLPYSPVAYSSDYDFYPNEKGLPYFLFAPMRWRIDENLNGAEAFNSEIIVYDGYLSTETKFRLMPSFLDNTNIPTSYKSKRIEYFVESSPFSDKNYFINYFFENSNGKKLTLKQRLYKYLSYTLKINDGVETTVWSDSSRTYWGHYIMGTFYCDKNNFLIFRDIQELKPEKSTDEYGEEIVITDKTIFWIREMRFQTNVLDKKESTFDL